MRSIDAITAWSAEVGWARRAARVGLALARRHAPCAILVSSPPHPTQLTGVLLSRRLGVPYVADFRDPWLFGSWDARQATLIDNILGQRLQRRTFRTASLSVFNTTRAMQEALAHDPTLERRVATVPNGYDPRTTISRPDLRHFRVTFVGWLYNCMDPRPLFAACARLRAREHLDDTLRIQFGGTDAAPQGVPLTELARAHGLEANFEHRARMPRAEALELQDSAAVQIVFDYPGIDRVPMKFYDAVQAFGDLLLVGRSPSALADAATRLGLQVCAPDDVGAMDAVLANALGRWRAGEYSRPLDAEGLFSRGHTNDRMIELLEGLCAP